jgi:hypothetical protein
VCLGGIARSAVIMANLSKRSLITSQPLRSHASSRENSPQWFNANNSDFLTLILWLLEDFCCVKDAARSPFWASLSYAVRACSDCGRPMNSEAVFDSTKARNGLRRIATNLELSFSRSLESGRSNRSRSSRMSESEAGSGRSQQKAAPPVSRNSSAASSQR